MSTSGQLQRVQKLAGERAIFFLTIPLLRRDKNICLPVILLILFDQAKHINKIEGCMACGIPQRSYGLFHCSCESLLCYLILLNILILRAIPSVGLASIFVSPTSTLLMMDYRGRGFTFVARVSCI
jgi:hypothetical protein